MKFYGPGVTNRKRQGRLYGCLKAPGKRKMPSYSFCVVLFNGFAILLQRLREPGDIPNTIRPRTERFGADFDPRTLERYKSTFLFSFCRFDVSQTLDLSGPNQTAWYQRRRTGCCQSAHENLHKRPGNLRTPCRGHLCNPLEKHLTKNRENMFLRFSEWFLLVASKFPRAQGWESVFLKGIPRY